MAKYQKYAEYKNSGVEWLGKIPSDWKVVKLSYKLKLLSGDGITAFDIEDTGTYPVFGGNGLRGFTEQYNCDGEYALIGRQGALCGNINVARGKFFATEHAVVVYPYETFNLTFLSEFLRFMDLGQYSVSAAQPGIAVDRINTLPIVIPTLGEQNAIGAFLDHETAKIDTLITKQKKLIELLKEKRQAVISHAVTKGLNSNVPMKDSGVEWLGQVPEHWIVSKLKYESEVVDCRNKTPEYFENGEYFVIRTTNVKNQKLNFNGALYTDKKNFEIWTQRGVPPAGSILFTREAPTGEVCLVPENIKFCMGQRMMNFIANTKSYSDYLFDYLISDCLERYINSVSHGSTVTHLRVEQVENIPVLVPSDAEIKEIHHHILIIKNKYDAIENKAHQIIQLMQERRTALISAAVTGKIDVQNWQNPTEAKMEFSA
ncbi:restriction endonuclease subunit S [Acinetobacter sp. ANC 3781]